MIGRLCRALLARLAGRDDRDEVLGDFEEARRLRRARHPRPVAELLTLVDALDMARALLVLRVRLPAPSLLDVKLGARMVTKHAGLSAVSILGMAVGVAIGASAFGVIRAVTASELPLDEGDRIVTVQMTSTYGMEQARARHLHQLEAWRTQAPALAEVGAYRTLTRNVITADGGVESARIVEMTPSGFRIARTPPALGRYLVEEDLRAGAEPVVVLGHGVWRDLFGEDPAVIGRTIRLGATPHRVVGVMPPGFAFPINNRIWTPLRLRAEDFAEREAPPLDVFARLAPGATLEEARTQVDGLARRAAAGRPDLYEGLAGSVFPYAQEMFWGRLGWFLYLGEALVTLLLVVIATNVGVLVYARTMARTGEMAVRTALGASRARIVTQLFVESFVLSGLGAALGLLAASRGVAWAGAQLRVAGGEQVPFWWSFELTPATLAYAGFAAVLASLIIGVVPALRVTGARMQQTLQRSGAGAGGPRLGRTWSALIVAQVAVAVAILPVATSAGAKWLGSDARGGFPAVFDETVLTRLYLDQEGIADLDAGPAGGARYRLLRERFAERVADEAGVTAVVPYERAPWEDPDLRFQLDGGRQGAAEAGVPVGMESASTGHRVGRSVVDPAFFAAFGLAPTRGRLLTESDGDTEAAPVVVNRTFVDLVLGGSPAPGRAIRFPASDAPTDPGDIRFGAWHTIVGVVPDMMPRGLARPEARAYLPLPRDWEGPVGLAVRTEAGSTARVAGRLRRVAAEVDPMLRLDDLGVAGDRLMRGVEIGRLFVLTLLAVGLAVLLLAVGGLYALVSFSVVRRRREIGIRTALGARPGRVVRGVLVRAFQQLAVGVVLGLASAWGLDRLLGSEFLGGSGLLYLPAVAALMFAVAVAAAWGPARRGLAVQPTEALRAE